jgi:hypothetical protein
MSGFLLVVLCLAAYGGGLVVLRNVTPLLLKRRFDDVLFMGLAAAIILGSLLLFAPIGVMFAFFNGTTSARIVDTILLLVMVIVVTRITLRCFRPRYKMEVVRLSGILAGSYYLLVLGLTIYVIVLMFVQP